MKHTIIRKRYFDMIGYFDGESFKNLEELFKSFIDDVKNDGVPENAIFMKEYEEKYNPDGPDDWVPSGVCYFEWPDVENDKEYNDRIKLEKQIEKEKFERGSKKKKKDLKLLKELKEK